MTTIKKRLPAVVAVLAIIVPLLIFAAYMESFYLISFFGWPFDSQLESLDYFYFPAAYVHDFFTPDFAKGPLTPGEVID